jgi:hypothetical protein
MFFPGIPHAGVMGAAMAIQAINSYGTAVNQTENTKSMFVKPYTGSSDSIAASETRTTQKQSSSNSYSAALSDMIYDIRDINKDGYVSSLEALEYELTHPGEVTASQAAAPAAKPQANMLYNQQGTLDVVSGGSQGMISLFV